MNVVSDSIMPVINSSFAVFAAFVPKFIAGFLVLFIGLVVSSLLKDLVRLVLHYFRVQRWLEATGVVKDQKIQVWPNIVAELVRWTVIFLFLNSAVDVWGIPKVGEVLNQLLYFIPNVFVAVVVGLMGFVAGKFAFDIVRHSVRGLGSKESLLLGTMAKYAILFFTVLIILNQLGVAAELVKILFTGIVAMFTLAIGLSFGLGGQEEAKNLLKKLHKRLDQTSDSSTDTKN